ncbi:hypothetical protein NBRC116589_17620 [Ruegeria sp. HU-ET01832]
MSTFKCLRNDLVSAGCNKRGSSSLFWLEAQRDVSLESCGKASNTIKGRNQILALPSLNSGSCQDDVCLG